jgi:hypothetical protein
MTRESIIKFARQVGLPHWYQTEGVVNEALLIKFATLVAQQEREDILAVIGDNQCECRCSEVVRDRGQA